MLTKRSARSAFRARTRVEDLVHAETERRELPARIAFLRAAKDAARRRGQLDLTNEQLHALRFPGEDALS